MASNEHAPQKYNSCVAVKRSSCIQHADHRGESYPIKPSPTEVQSYCGISKGTIAQAKRRSRRLLTHFGTALRENRSTISSTANILYPMVAVKTVVYRDESPHFDSGFIILSH
jgi:hypothetical protein